MKFEELGIIDPIMKSINEKQFDEPTEVQERAIPATLEGRDVFAGSRTGSGKTLAFAVSMIEKAVRGDGVQAIVLTPTRELAQQVADEIRFFAKHKDLRVTPIYGGVGIQPQIEALHETEIVVGTPGRVLDHLGRRTLDLSNVKVAVLDEADRMLDMGFIDDVKDILDKTPRDRQTLLFSATISYEIRNIAGEYLDNPVEVSVARKVDPSKLKQVYYDVDSNQKLSLLVHLLKKEQHGLAMVFCNTQRTTDFVAKNLKKQGFDVTALHGGYSQAKRERKMDKFHEGKFEVLVCTDVAARGLHIEDVTHIYNYDIPDDHKSYIHRIGRTARAGEEGMAINLLSDKDYRNMDAIFRYHDVHVEKREVPEVKNIRIVTKKQHRSRRRHRRRH